MLLLSWRDHDDQLSMLSSTSSPSSANILLENIKLRRPYFILAASPSGRYFGRAVRQDKKKDLESCCRVILIVFFAVNTETKLFLGTKKCYLILATSLSGCYFGRAVSARQEERPGVMLSRDSDSVLSSKY